MESITFYEREIQSVAWFISSFCLQKCLHFVYKNVFCTFWRHGWGTLQYVEIVAMSCNISVKCCTYDYLQQLFKPICIFYNFWGASTAFVCLFLHFDVCWMQNTCIAWAALTWMDHLHCSSDLDFWADNNYVQNLARAYNKNKLI